MANNRFMLRFARWHVWLGWLVGVPLLMWTITGLVMVSRPIEEVRGEHLRIEAAEPALPAGNPVPIAVPLSGSAPAPVREYRTAMQRGRPTTFVTHLDGRIERFDATSGDPLDTVDALTAREIVEQTIEGGDAVNSVTLFEANETPIDFRRPTPVWQVALKDGTYVYVGRDSGEIEAVRTRFWRVFDTMWGLHIMDLKTREDTSHPILILFTALSALAVMLGCVLLFRRRKSVADRDA